LITLIKVQSKIRCLNRRSTSHLLNTFTCFYWNKKKKKTNLY